MIKYNPSPENGEFPYEVYRGKDLMGTFVDEEGAKFFDEFLIKIKL